MEYTKKLLDEIGLGSERLEFFYIAASEAPLFAEVVKIMTERAIKLGPNPVGESFSRRVVKKMRSNP